MFRRLRTRERGGRRSEKEITLATSQGDQMDLNKRDGKLDALRLDTLRRKLQKTLENETMSYLYFILFSPSVCRTYYVLYLGMKHA